jgi:hypothetical protein
MYIPEASYGAVLKVSTDGTVRRIVGSNKTNDLGDGGSPLLANLTGISYSPNMVAIDAAGNFFIPQGNRIREVVAGSLAVRLSMGRIDFQGPAPQAQGVLVTTNVAEPLPFQAQATSSGGTWLKTNRSTGQTGDTLTVSANPNGLAPGVYTGSIEISMPGTTAAPVSLPVSLTVK